MRGIRALVKIREVILLALMPFLDVMHAKDIRLFITTIILLTCELNALDGDDTSEEKILVIGSGVTNQEFIELKVDSRLEELLNVVKCHRCTALRHISVRRISDGAPFSLRVSNNPESRHADLEIFEPKSGDIVVVPCRMFSEGNHDIPVTVSGPFYVISRERVEIEEAHKQIDDDNTVKPTGDERTP